MPEEPIHPEMQKLLKAVAGKFTVRDVPSGIGSRLKRRLETSEGRASIIDQVVIERSQKLAEQLRKECPEAFE